MLHDHLSQIANVNSSTFSAIIELHCKKYALVPQWATNADMPSQTTGMHPAGKLRTQRLWLLCSTTALPERRSVTQHSLKRNTGPANSEVFVCGEGTSRTGSDSIQGCMRDLGHGFRLSVLSVACQRPQECIRCLTTKQPPNLEPRVYP